LERGRGGGKREHTRQLGSPVRHDSQVGNVLREKEEEKEEKREKKEEELPDLVRACTKENGKGEKDRI
jgi:hypothetical protein